MIIKHFEELDINSLESIEEALSTIEPMMIDKVNWRDQFPYAPQVKCRMAHSGSHLVVRYDVNEQYTMAKVTSDMGRSWTDSCVELFISFDQRGYYNFEATPIGKILLGFRKERENPTAATLEDLAPIIRYTTMGTTPFDEREGDNHWSLTLAIPTSALFSHSITSWSGLSARINLFKCGDELTVPHFLSWAPITNPKPDFHKEEFFREVKFE